MQVVAKGSTLALLVALASLAMAGAARADVAPPNTSDCVSKQVSAACMLDDGSMGFCAAMTCSHPTPDGSTSSPCNVCQAAGSDGGTTTTTTTTTTANNGCSIGARAGGAFGVLGIAAACAALAGRRRRRDHSSS